jgi:protein subunit release factor B
MIARWSLQARSGLGKLVLLANTYCSRGKDPALVGNRVQTQLSWVVSSKRRAPATIGQRRFSSADRKFTVDQGALTFKAVRSSGPGGQNVNKVATCVEIRFTVLEAEWMPLEVRERMAEQQRNRINKSGELVISVQQERTQELNRRLALSMIQEMVDAATVEPKVRDMWTGIGDEGKLKRREEKRHRTQVKAARRSSSKDDW